MGPGAGVQAGGSENKSDPLILLFPSDCFSYWLSSGHSYNCRDSCLYSGREEKRGPARVYSSYRFCISIVMVRLRIVLEAKASFHILATCLIEAFLN